MNTAYLVVADLHWYYKNFKSHKNYRNEMQQIKDTLIGLAGKYRKEGFNKVSLLLMGDVFHRGYQDVFSAMVDAGFFTSWSRYVGDIYSVVGNHELHYYASNPFFALLSEIGSCKILESVNSIWTPLGTDKVINVIDELSDGEVVFHFNHYGTKINKPVDNKVNIGLFHQDIANSQIIERSKQILGYNTYAPEVSNVEKLASYQYSFLGHMHQMYGTFKTDDGHFICYLGSLGRTSSAEVDDHFLERMIPCVKVIDGKFNGIDQNKFNLPDRDSTLNLAVVEEKAIQYELTKKKKEARSYVALDDNPMDGLKSYFVNSPVALAVIDDLATNPIDRIGEDLRKRFKEIIGD